MGSRYRLCECGRGRHQSRYSQCKQCQWESYRRSTLNETDRGMLAFFAFGLSTEQIGAEIGRSRKAVNQSFARIKKRLGLTSPQELTRYAIYRGLIPNSLWPGIG